MAVSSFFIVPNCLFSGQMSDMNRWLVLVVSALIFWGCQEKEKTLFQLLDPDDTGVHFANTIIDSRDFNILNTFY